MTTPDIEHTVDGGSIPAQRPHDRRPVAEQPVRHIETAIGAGYHVGREPVPVKNFRLTTSAHEIDVIGGGPAGAMAGIAARLEGARVRIFEKSAFPRHKVCGEFLSPDVLTLLTRAGCADAFINLRPAVIRSMTLHMGTREIHGTLPAPAYGLSRYALDHLLLTAAASLGADVVHAKLSPHAARRPVVVTSGRSSVVRRGTRLFGFKAHYRGTANDTVELFVFDGCYVGVSAVEGGMVNVCGLAPERLLQASAFDPERLLTRCAALQTRMRGRERDFDWLITGPLVPGWTPRDESDSREYPAGDALGFVDPFTGSGMLNAMASGFAAGTAAARGTSAQTYLAGRRRALRRPFLVSALVRGALAAGVAAPLVSALPMRWWFHLTRPSV